MQLIYHSEVRNDLAEAAGFLEEKRSGLGAAFIADAERTVLSIVENPFRFALLRDGTRRARLDRFPYAVYFDQPDAATVRILVLTHAARQPGHWYSRRAG